MNATSKRPRATAESVGSQIKRLRNEANMTQQEVADRSGIIRTHVARIEMGDANPTLLTLKSLAKSLNVDMRRFFELP